MLLSHKIELRPTKEQEKFLLQSVGVRRFTYNSLLAIFSGDSKLKWSKKEALNQLSLIKEENPWMKDVSSRTSRNVVDDLDYAFSRFFKKTSNFPKFKKKGDKDSFSIREKEKFDVKDRSLRIEKLKTRMPMRENLRFKGVAKQCTISCRAGKWFASILVEIIEHPCQHIDMSARKLSVGVDLGVANMMTLSDGHKFPKLQPLNNSMKKLKGLQKKMSRQKKGSVRREETRKRIAKLHYHIANQRKDVLHIATDFLTKSYTRITIEDLSVSGMLKDRKLSGAVSDIGFWEFRRQLEYKAPIRGCDLVIANRWFPSSKTCSSCGHKQEITLDKRVFKCKNCNLEIDRDLNAAINLEKYSPDTFKRDSKTDVEGCETHRNLS